MTLYVSVFCCRNHNMKGKRKRRKGIQSARDKVERREELHQSMAIRSISTREKRKEEEKKSKSSERTLGSAPSTTTNFKDKPVSQDTNAHQNSKDASTIPEVFDSSKYNSMKEMNETANVEEGGRLKEVLSRVENEETIRPTVIDPNASSMNINSPSTAASDTPDAGPPSLEKRAATLRSPKEEYDIENSLADSKKELQEKVIVNKDKETNTGLVMSSPKVAGPYTSLWQDTAKFWNDSYIEYTRRVSEMNKIWLDLFSNFWFFGYMK
jgi:hypothetical protein